MLGDCHFSGCSKLRYVSLPSLEYVSRGSANVFEGCHDLDRIDLPRSPPSFHDDVFRNAKELYEGVVPISLCLRSANYYLSYTGSNEYGQWKGLIEPTNYLEACSGYAEAQTRNVSQAALIGTITGVLVLVVSLIVIIVVVIKCRRRTHERNSKGAGLELMGDF